MPEGLYKSSAGRRKWQPIPVFLPGESRGLRSLVGCHLWCRHTQSRNGIHRVGTAYTESERLKRLSSSSNRASHLERLVVQQRPREGTGSAILRVQATVMGTGICTLRFITSSRGLANLSTPSPAQAQEATGTKKGSGTQSHSAAGPSPGNTHYGRAAGPN